MKCFAPYLLVFPFFGLLQTLLHSFFLSCFLPFILLSLSMCMYEVYGKCECDSAVFGFKLKRFSLLLLYFPFTIQVPNCSSLSLTFSSSPLLSMLGLECISKIRNSEFQKPPAITRLHGIRQGAYISLHKQYQIVVNTFLSQSNLYSPSITIQFRT